MVPSHSLGKKLIPIYSTLGVTYKYIAVVDHDWFDGFAVQDYVDKKTWCEYGFSKFAYDTFPDFLASFAKMQAMTGVKVE